MVERVAWVAAMEAVAVMEAAWEAAMEAEK